MILQFIINYIAGGFIKYAVQSFHVSGKSVILLENFRFQKIYIVSSVVPFLSYNHDRLVLRV